MTHEGVAYRNLWNLQSPDEHDGIVMTLSSRGHDSTAMFFDASATPEAPRSAR